MPDLSKAEVERRLEAIRINAGTVLTLDQTVQTEALQTALSLYARAEAAEQERDAFRAEALGMREYLENIAKAGYVGIQTARELAQNALDDAPLTAAAAERVKAMERVCEAAKRHEAATQAVFRKWDADAWGIESKDNGFTVHDLECCCCPEHVEFQAAKEQLDSALAALAAWREGEG